MNKENEMIDNESSSVEKSPVKQEDDNPTIPVKRSETPTASRPFVLKKWNPVALWNFDCQEDTCAICRVLLMEECLLHQYDPTEREFCIVYEGYCNHSFHSCCVMKWMKVNQRCPICSEDWNIMFVYRRPQLPEVNSASTSDSSAADPCVTSDPRATSDPRDISDPQDVSDPQDISDPQDVSDQ